MLRRFFNWRNWRGRFVYCLTFIVIGLHCGAVTESLAATAVVKWDRSPSSDVAGYVVYYGTQSRQYEYEEDCGDVTECELFSLDDPTYYIAVRAYNWVDQFSDYSDEVVYPAFNNDGGDCGGGGNPGDSCGAGKVLDCALNCVDSATAQSYIGDGYCDDGTWGYVLTCPEFNNDGGDCGGGGNPGDSCGAGKVLDCALNCVDSATAQSYIGDGYCDDGTWGYVLTCPEFNNDAGDCGG